MAISPTNKLSTLLHEAKHDAKNIELYTEALMQKVPEGPHIIESADKKHQTLHRGADAEGPRGGHMSTESADK